MERRTLLITDMTVGAPAKVLWKFSIPMLLSIVFQQFYNVADSIIAGRFAGEEALAAVGASYPITMIFMAVAAGVNIGCSVVISQLFGGKFLKQMKTAVSTSTISTAVLSAALTAVGLFTCRPMLQLLRTPGNIFADSALYLNIYIGGLFFLFLYNICTGIFTALGDSRTPLYFLILSSVANILLDLLFVITFHMGVGGVAWATFLAQGASAVLAALALLKRLNGIKTGSYKVFSWEMLRKIAVIAVPSILQQSFISVGNLCIQGLVNGYGSSVIAGYSAAVKLNTFAITSFTALANGLSSFTAQNIGAGKPARVKRGFHAGLGMAVCVSLPFFLLFFLVGGPMTGLFMDARSSAAAIGVGVRFLRIVAPFYFLISIKLMADAVLRGTGAMTPFMISTFSDLVLRVLLSFVLSSTMGAVGIWSSWPIGWTVATGISCGFYLSGAWKKKHTILAKEE